ncbi:MAG: transposase [Planctomycetaceae bacterium]|nr:transposase [Planctomycetaceae bacterium]MCB9941513.1 transposase [Planctomycetaceae bacterium]HRX81468.1 transposase [Pirellulaceae bacterium]
MNHQLQSNNLDQLVQLLAQEGFDSMAEAITVLMNEAMKLEWAEVLQDRSYERTEQRTGYANGFTHKTVNSRIGNEPPLVCVNAISKPAKPSQIQN